MDARIMSTMVAFLPAQSVSGPISKKILGIVKVLS